MINQPWKLSDGRIINLIHEDEYKNIPFGTIVICIDGTSIVKSKDSDNINSKNYIDKDTRGHFLAYGLLKEDK